MKKSALFLFVVALFTASSVFAVSIKIKNYTPYAFEFAATEFANKANSRWSKAIYIEPAREKDIVPSELVFGGWHWMVIKNANLCFAQGQSKDNYKLRSSEGWAIRDLNSFNALSNQLDSLSIFETFSTYDRNTGIISGDWEVEIKSLVYNNNEYVVVLGKVGWLGLWIKNSQTGQFENFYTKASQVSGIKTFLSFGGTVA